MLNLQHQRQMYIWSNTAYRLFQSESMILDTQVGFYMYNTSKIICTYI